MFSHQNRGHLKTNKSKTNLRRGKEPGQLKGTFGKKIKRMLNES